MTETIASAPQAQLTAAREGVLLLAPPLVDLEPLRVRGKDRVQWLNGMVTSDVAKLPVGGAQYSLHVGKTGKIVAELWIVHGESELVVGVPRGRADELQAALDRYLIMENCEIVSRDPDAAFALALGPTAGRVVEDARAAGLGGGLAKRAGLPMGVLFGEGGALEALLASHVDGQRVRATAEGWEQVRVELGIGAFGVDFDATAYPQEAALEVDAVSFSKGCYLGQEAVFMMQERGHPPRKMVRLAGDPARAEPFVVGGAVTTSDRVEVGKVTSVGAATALATVKWKYAKDGTELGLGDAITRVRA